MKCAKAGRAMSLEVGSTERSLSIVCDTDAAREFAAEAEEKRQQGNAAEYQSTGRKMWEAVHHLEKCCLYWHSCDTIYKELFKSLMVKAKEITKLGLNSENR